MTKLKGFNANASEVAALIEALTSIERQFARLTTSLSHQQFNWQPATEKWSIGQTADHVNLANEKFIRKIRRAVEQMNLTQNGGRPVAHTIFGRMYKRVMEPPVRMRLPAPKAFVPVSAKLPDEVIRRFGELQGDLARLMRDYEPYDWRRIKLSSPVTRLIKLNLFDVFVVLTAHERRHLWQMENVASSPDFPKA